MKGQLTNVWQVYNIYPHLFSKLAPRFRLQWMACCIDLFHGVYYLSFDTMVQSCVMRKSKKPVKWLPVDSRLFLPLFSFGHVRGIARFFLEIEIILSILVVIGTLALFMLAAIS